VVLSSARHAVPSYRTIVPAVPQAKTLDDSRHQTSFSVPEVPLACAVQPPSSALIPAGHNAERTTAGISSKHATATILADAMAMHDSWNLTIGFTLNFINGKGRLRKRGCVTHRC